MKTIYKYTIKPSMDILAIKTFKDAKILSVGMDGFGVNSLWMEVDTKKDPEIKYFICVGTGWELDFFDNMIAAKTYIGTVNCDGYIWHTYEVSLCE